MYPTVLTTDLHLTDRADDEYRWTVFDQIFDLHLEHDTRTLLILGDLTDAKDRHSAILVNRIVSTLTSLAQSMRIIVLRGNHDYEVKEHPFFEFLNTVCNGKVDFINEPTCIEDWVFIPHSRETPLPGLDLVSQDTTHCFLHQTVMGARASNGQEMDGELRQTDLPHAKTCKYYSGDIHVPQEMGVVEYVGSPYPVHYGDKFKPHILVLDKNGDTVHEHVWKGIRRWSETIKSPKALDQLPLRKGDQVKLTVALSRADLPEWQQIKREVVNRCKDLEVQLVSCKLAQVRVRQQLVNHNDPASKYVATAPEAVFDRYCSNRGIDPQIVDIGADLLKDSHAARKR